VTIALPPLALSHARVDRAALHRLDPDWLASAWLDPRTRVLVVSAGQAAVRDCAGQPSLALLPTADAPVGERFFLGLDGDVARFAVVAADYRAEPGVRLAGAAAGDVRR
jgi:NAD+ diphosphatase